MSIIGSWHSSFLIWVEIELSVSVVSPRAMSVEHVKRDIISMIVHTNDHIHVSVFVRVGGAHAIILD